MPPKKAAAGAKNPIVPESFKRKADRDAKLKAAADAAGSKKVKDDAEKVKTITAKAKAHEEDYNALEKAAIDNRRAARANGDIYVAPEEKLLFVIRVRGINGVSPKTKKILQLLRLRQLHNGVFVRVNAATIKMVSVCVGGSL